MADGLDQVLGNLDDYIEQVRTRLELAMTKIMADLEADAKADHPYTDQTGLNTKSISGFVSEVTDTVIRGKLTASMAYSLYLETARKGKYAFLAPTIERNKDKIMPILESLV